MNQLSFDAYRIEIVRQSLEGTLVLLKALQNRVQDLETEVFGVPEQETPCLRKQPRLGDRTSILKSWVERHRDHPYPNRDQLALMVEASGLSKVQVRNWLTNYRSRVFRKKPKGPKPCNNKSLP